MRDWIVGLSKGASERGEGATPDRFDGLGAFPDELKDLYLAMNGASLDGAVRLWPLNDEGVLAPRDPLAGLPLLGVWRFGAQGEGGQLFAARQRDIDASLLPEWAQELDAEVWLFGIHRGDDDVRVYRSLEQLLARLVPPAQTEEFGDMTYARALNAVQGALDGLDDEDEDAQDADFEDVVSATSRVEVTEVLPRVPFDAQRSAPPAKAKSKAKSKPKPAAKKASSKKAAGAKKKPAKKLAAKKVGKKKPAPKAKAKKPSKAKKVAPKKAARARKAPARAKARKAAKPARRAGARKVAKGKRR